MIINTTFDASANNAPAGFKNGIAAVVEYFDKHFSDPVTINIAVGYGEVDGQSLGSGALGESVSFFNSFSYNQLRNSLVAHATSSDDQTATGSLPAVDPHSGSYWVSTAEAKALGLQSAGGSIDGYVGFSNQANLFTWNNSDGVAPSQYDFFGVASHEFSEILGRSIMAGSSFAGVPHSYEPLDLFHYSSPGVRAFDGSHPGYFSIDAGATNLDNFNTASGGDLGDWAASAGNDAALAFSRLGVVNPFTPTDLRALDVIGWTRAPADTQGVLVQNHTTSQLDFLEFSGGQLIASADGPQLWHVGAEGDFNHDGKTDLVTQQNGQIDLVFVTGSQLTGSQLENGAYWDVKAAGNYPFADGIVTQDAVSHQINILGFNGLNLATSDLLQGSYWNVVGEADFNHDGHPAIVTQSDTGQIDLLFFSGASLVGSALLSGNYSPVHGVEDFNHDGNPGLVAQDANGAVEHLIFSGSHVASVVHDTPAVPGYDVVNASHVANQYWFI